MIEGIIYGSVEFEGEKEKMADDEEVCGRMRLRLLYT